MKIRNLISMAALISITLITSGCMTTHGSYGPPKEKVIVVHETNRHHPNNGRWHRHPHNDLP